MSKLQPIISTFAPRTDNVHDFSTGSVRYWVDIELKQPYEWSSLPLLGDLISGVVVEDLNCSKPVKFLVRSHDIFQCDDRWNSEYFISAMSDNIDIKLLARENPKFVTRVEYVLLKDG